MRRSCNNRLKKYVEFYEIWMAVYLDIYGTPKPCRHFVEWEVVSERISMGKGY